MTADVLELPVMVTPEAEANWRAMLAEIADAAFAPRSTLSLSEWADEKRYLSADLGEPGKWRTDRVPYMREPMNAITDPRVREVSIMKPTRIGATQAVVLNSIGYHVDQEPASLIVALPSLDDAKNFSTLLMQPMFDDTACLAGKLEEVRSNKRRATMLKKTFPGGSIQIIGVKSPRALRQVHARVIFMSEIDAWDFSAGAEGAPDALLVKRAGAYGNPKFIRESSPLYAGTSRIEAAVESGTDERLFVPCPHCREYQRLVFGGRDVHYGIKWDRGRPETVHYVCEHNGCVIEESLKFQMVAANEWVKTHPERVDHRSFRLNAFCSPFDGARWELLVREFLATHKKPERLRVFVNTVLGETFREDGKSAEATVLERRREPAPAPEITWQVPAGVGKLVRVFDTQDDRLEWAVFGFGADEELWPIDADMIEGDPGIPEGQPGSPWDRATELLETTYVHESSLIIAPAITGIDLGGHHTKQVYAWARSHLSQRVYALQGSNLGEGVPTVSRQKYSNTGKAFFYSIGVFTIKEAILARLAKIDEPGPGYIHIPWWMNPEQLAQLTAEELVTKPDGKREFRKRRDRNEFLDLTAYAFGMLHALGYGVVRSLGDVALALMADGQRERADAETSASGSSHPDPDTDEPAVDEPSIGLRSHRGGWGPRA